MISPINACIRFIYKYWPTRDTIIISHEGTEATQLRSVLIDLKVPQTTLASDLFPDVPTPTAVPVYPVFEHEHSLTASGIRSEVTRLMERKHTNNVTLVGHSLGRAEFDPLFFTLNLPTSANVHTVVFDTSRVGNAEFATLIDSDARIGRFSFVQYVIPIVPDQFLGFEHPQLLGNENAVSCPGDDDAFDFPCQIKTVLLVSMSNIIDHASGDVGPFVVYIYNVYFLLSLARALSRSGHRDIVLCSCTIVSKNHVHPCFPFVTPSCKYLPES
ncbi:hypothetical protein F5050DRAFT_1579630 [Lentinula boryana]|uniref:Fungal lipase-type domain-containing protein n=1 Tax=Lentinula boryana TaxID=40481 RepID=A0ABQ8Q168_9AGAR|nr:hypothetical protein F5050DRAFT_1579630 [Lentinula boryana]